jgi:hypothetical protein
VAIANVEAFRDGMLEPTPARLEALLQALAEVEVLLGELPRPPISPATPAESPTVEI